MTKKRMIITEGPTDRAVMKAVLKKMGMGDGYEVYPDKQPPKPGRDAAIDYFISLTKARSYALLLLDFDDHDMDGLKQDVQKRANKKGVKINTDRIIGVGMKGDRTLKKYGITRFAMDDYIFGLFINPGVFKILQRHEKHLKGIEYDRVIEKLGSIQELFKDNGIPILSTKRYIPLIQATTGWVLGPGTLYAKVIKSAPKDKIEKFFKSILNAIEQLDSPGN